MPENTGLYRNIRIKNVIEEVKGFNTFVFEDGHGITWKSGQYLTLVHHLSGNEIRRSYSIISSPELNEPLAIGVKRMTNGFFSRLLVDHAQAADEFISTGTGGFFVLPPNVNDYRQLFFFAAGSGITPIYAMIKTVLHLHPTIAVTLFYSNTSPATTVFREELQILRNTFSDRFQIEWFFSNAPDLSKARLYRELLIKLLETHSTTDHSKTLFYVCGPLPYMRMCTYVLQEMSVPPGNIRKENFIIDKILPPQQLPPDTEPHIANIHYGISEYHIPVHYPDTILQAAKKKGIVLPYSCETGRCGNCVATCVSGIVWLSYNEVLTDKDLANGLTLTCVGHPVGGDVELRIKGL